MTYLLRLVACLFFGFFLKKSSFFQKATFLILFMINLASCSGGSDSSSSGSDSSSSSSLPDNQAEVVAVGQFKDSSVEGLSYRSGSISGSTDASGTFYYVVGQEVIFSVGGVELGRSEGKELITPLDITSESSEAINIVRFLMMLDDDQDPDNGIRISNDIQLQSNSWSLVNWSNSVFAEKIIEFKSDADAVTTFSHKIPSAENASNHLRRTLSCLNSGYYQGNYNSSNDSGVIDMIIDPNSGVISGFKRGVDYIYADQEPLILEKNPKVKMFSETPSIQVNGELMGVGKIMGTWNDGATSGSFEAQRKRYVRNQTPVIERYVSSYSVNTSNAYPHTSSGYIVVEFHSSRDFNTLYTDSDISIYGYDSQDGAFRVDYSDMSVSRWLSDGQGGVTESNNISISYDVNISCGGSARINIDRAGLSASGSLGGGCCSGKSCLTRGGNGWSAGVAQSLGCKLN